MTTGIIVHTTLTTHITEHKIPICIEKILYDRIIHKTQSHDIHFDYQPIIYFVFYIFREILIMHHKFHRPLSVSWNTETEFRVKMMTRQETARLTTLVLLEFLFVSANIRRNFTIRERRNANNVRSLLC